MTGSPAGQHPEGRRNRPVRLERALALASALPLSLLTLAIGSLNWWNGHQSAQTLAYALGNATSEQVRLQLDQLLASPRQVNGLNRQAIAEGRLDPDDFAQLARTFISQMRVFPVSYINYGSEQGDFVGIERLDDGSLALNLTDRRLGASRQFVYPVGPDGPERRPRQIHDPIPPAKEEVWYRETVRADAPTWSSIYQWDDKPQILSISFNEPVRFPDGRLRGVIGIDFTLSQLSSKLAAIWKQRPGLLLITERNGLLVASSRGSTTLNSPGEPPRRRRLDQRGSPLEREAARLLFVPQASGEGIRLHEALIRRNARGEPLQNLNTSSTFIEALPWGDRHGLNWLVLVIIPKQDLTAAIQQQTLFTSLLGLLSLLVLLLLSNRVTRWALHPLENLSEAARRLGESIRRSPGSPLQFEPGLARGSAEEIETLGGAFDNLISTFNGMVAALRRSGNRLQRELEQKAAALDRATRREQEARQASAARERFIGHLGRALLQPVADLRGATRLARCEQEPARLSHQLERIDASARRLERLAHMLRDHARLAEGALVLAHEAVDLPQLLESTVAELQPIARGRGVQLNWRMAPGTPRTVQGNGEGLGQVLEQLVSRGLRASSEGEVRLEAAPLQEAGQTWVRLQILDRGDGRDAGHLEQALCGPDPLPSPSDPDQLADLGLSVSRQLLALMGGSAGVEHRAGLGSTVTLRLPVAAPWEGTG